MPLTRTLYFPGRLLTQADFEREQAYAVERWRRHLRFTLGWGVVQGLQVALAGDEVVVAPGMAVDCLGRELVTEAEVRLPFAGRSAAFFVAIGYTETPGDPQPLAPSDPPGEVGTAFTTVTEGARVLLADDNPCAGHAQRGPGTPGCGQAHAVVLARVRPHGEGWRLRAARGRR
jgi:hypothetical protein